MANFSIERVPNEPIVIVTEYNSYDTSKDVDLVIRAILAELEHFDRPGYAIIVERSGYNVEDILIAASEMRHKGERLRNHPRYRGALFVTSSDFNKLALDGMSSEALGNLKYNVFETLEEALAHARSA